MRIFLCGFEKIPFKEPHSVAAEVSQIQTSEALRQVLSLVNQDKLVVFKCESLNLEHLLFAEGLVQAYSVKIIFWVRVLEGPIYEAQKKGLGSSIFLFDQSRDLQSCLQQIVEGVRSTRRELRTALKAKVIVKNSTYSEINNPLRRSVKVILDGCFEDFSKMGAKIKLEINPFREKEFVCLMYQDFNGRWVEVESQVRWVKELGVGCLLGLQFVARTI